MKKSLTTTALAIFITGCVTSTADMNMGVDSNLEYERVVNTVKKGVSTRADILNAFGEPTSKGVDARGYERWEYTQIDTKAKTTIPYMMLGSIKVDTDTEHTTLAIFFSEDGVVADYDLSVSNMPSRMVVK